LTGSSCVRIDEAKKLTSRRYSAAATESRESSKYLGVQMKKLAFGFGGSLAIFVLVSGLFGQAFVSPYSARLKPFLTGLDRPVLIRSAKDGSKRLFIVQQTGIIKVLQPGSNTPTTFINLSSKIVVPVVVGDERGLLGMTFSPQFATNGKFYVNYTRSGDGTTVVAEYKTSTGNGTSNTGDITTERILFTVPQPFTNHNGGMVEFGPDGFLYIGMGDGGSANDPGARAQNKAQLLGKVLRIDPNVPEGSSPQYAIPPTNPFTGAGTARCDTGSTTNGTICQEIWTYGMRNPWRWSFDRGGTNQLYLADVGQDAIEELDIITGGGNYGWRVYEGLQCTNLDPQLCSGGATPITKIDPYFQYSHASGRCSVTGGYVYRGTQGSLPNGAYTFADYCTGEIWMWQNNAQVLLQDTPRQVISFGEDEDGEIYVCYANIGAASGTGQIDKITRSKAPADFEGDAKTDISVFRPSTGTWFVLNSSNNAVQVTSWGVGSDTPVPGDYDGDNISDVAVYRPATGQWFVLRSSDSTVNVMGWGAPGDIPNTGDYDGDARSDFAVWRPSSGTWFVFRSSDNGVMQVQLGAPGDKVATGDYDGDGKTDVALWRPSDGMWNWVNSTNGVANSLIWGADTDMNVSADYDGDGRIDEAVYRPSNGTWFILLSSNNSVRIIQWGNSTDLPEVGDYDGDGKSDVAVYRPSTGVWFVFRSSDGQVRVIGWGGIGDLPLPSFESP